MSDESEAARAAQPESTAPSTDAAKRRRAPILLAALFILLSVGLGSVWRNYDYWKAAWARGSLLPEASPRQSHVRGLAAFDLSNTTVPASEIRPGGPPKDGIPALTNPTHVAASEAGFLNPDDRVIGVESNGVARAYPLRILDFHEVANDVVGKLPIAVTYCPLCDSAAVFDRRSQAGTREFGVSGLLYNSNVLMYDRGAKTESLWSQLKAGGVSGPAANQSLAVLPVELTTWQDWLARHPKTTVLSPDTGHTRAYDGRAYARYFATANLMFPVKPFDERLPAKTKVLGLWTADAARAYPQSAFAGDRKRIEEQLDGEVFTIEFDPAADSLRVTTESQRVRWMYAFWFAWAAFRPDTEIYQ